jgi:hypothetical protein
MTSLQIHFENIHKLNTKEDSTLIHKGLGLACLLHFLYRYYLYFLYGSMFIQSTIDIFLVNIHAVLSISSFLFHIPSLRNPLKPMIYPEFRLHSIVFASRSVIICNIYYYNLHFHYIIFTCFVTMIGADMITWFFNQEGKNGKTMRNMPFEQNLDENLQIEVIKMHSIMQIGATTFMLGSIETAFSPLFAIQIAAFLMTLVRKSIISTLTWHAIYSLTLWTNLGFFTTLSSDYILIQQCMIHSFRNVFFPYKINKYIAWTILFGFYTFYKNYLENKYFWSWIDDYVFIIYLKKMVVLAIFGHYFYKFKTLFNN